MSIITVTMASTKTPAYLSTTSTSETTNALSTGLTSYTSTTTMVAFPVATPSTLPIEQTNTSAATQEDDSASSGLSQGAKDALYATTIIGEIAARLLPDYADRVRWHFADGLGDLDDT